MEPTSEPVRTEGQPDDFVQSVGRAMRILEVVGRRPGLPVKTIARRSALNVSTTYHLVRTLAYQGYLLRLPDGTYILGDAVARRYHDLVSSLDRPPEAAAVLRQLTHRTGLTSYLGVLQDERVTVVDLAESAGSPYLEDFEVGLEVSAHATALGKALVSALPARRRRALLRRQGLRRFTARTHTDLDRVEQELGRLRAGSAVVERGEFRDGVACTAALVPRHGPAAPTWAIVVAVRDEDVPRPVSAEVVLAAADLAGGTTHHA